MSWVNEKEEWLVDWAHARCVKELCFEDPAGGVARALQLGREDPLDVFFSDIIEIGDKCLVCRASGLTVDIFDVSPTADLLSCWRVHLPSPVLQDVGISHYSDANEAAVSISFLTKGQTIHRVVVLLQQTLEVVLAGFTACSLTSPPAAFCALGGELAAVACFDGTMHAFSLSSSANAGSSGAPRPPVYDFVDAPLVMKVFGRPSPLVLDMAAVGSVSGCFCFPGYGVLSFSSDGYLRLWQATDSRAKLVSKQALLPAAHEQQAASLAGSSSTYLRLSPSRTRGCLVQRGTLYVIDLSSPSGMVCREVQPPFPGASPSLVALSHGALWAFWSTSVREQMFRLDLDARHAAAWEARALDAGLPGSKAGNPQATLLATTGACAGTGGQGVVFTLYQQHEAWRLEEDGFEALRVHEAIADHLGDEPSLEELVLAWWLGRIFLPGRYSSAVLVAAIEDASGTAKTGLYATAERENFTEDGLRDRVREHLRAQAAACSMAGTVSSASAEPSRHMQAASAVASVSAEFLRVCNVIWRRGHQVCGMAISTTWAQHSWFPAGEISEVSECQAVGCPLLLCAGGASCIRPVHAWTERWWATLHLSRDLSNYEKIELDQVLDLVALDEWKLCSTAWFLSQTVCNANLGISLSLSQRDGSRKPAACIGGFLHDAPESLAACVAKCAERLGHTEGQLRTLTEAISFGYDPEKSSTVNVLEQRIDLFRGCWFDRRCDTAQLCLSDILRGSVAASESAYLCAATRDLLLLSLYASSETNLQGPAWASLQSCLEEQLPPLLSLASAQGLEAPVALKRTEAIPGNLQITLEEDVDMQTAPSQGSSAWRTSHAKHITPGLPARPYDLWAALFRTVSTSTRTSLGLRPPVASFRSLEYALELLRWQRWEALQSWCRHESINEVVAYMGGREWLAHQRHAEAREAFMHAERRAELLVSALRRAHLGEGLPEESGLEETPARVAFREHIASLFRSCGRLEDECFFLRLAALLAECPSSSEGMAGDTTGLRPAPVATRQRLWSAVFEREVGLQKWEDALKTLERIEAFEPHLRLLSQRLRSCGRIDLLLKLPEPHKTYFINNLHEHASMGMPTAGSDALACFQQLYALYFSQGEYLEAASVAHSLFASLGGSLRHFASMASTTDLGSSMGNARDELVLAGDCISDRSAVPQPSGAARKPTAMAAMEAASEAALNPHAQCLDHVWPLLEQQRSALLMLISALGLTPEKLLLAPGTKELSFAESLGSAEPQDVAGLQQWFSAAQAASLGHAVSVEDARRLLAVVEAQMVLSGGRERVPPPAEAAEAVASLGLLRLAVQVAKACGLDPWQCALRPFVHLCVEAEQAPGEKVQALAAAARGPAQAYMFLHSDGAAPLGSGGSVLRAWWQTLEGTLAEVTGVAGGKVLDAAAARLYSLVASEILSFQAKAQRSGAPQGRLPAFLVQCLGRGPSWVCLLRLYMKHRLLEDALELLREQLRRCCAQLKALEVDAWCPLRGFPAQLAVQLLRAARHRAREEPNPKASQLVESLESCLAQWQALLQDFEQSMPTASSA